jgi:hypothetical protein
VSLFSAREMATRARVARPDPYSSQDCFTSARRSLRPSGALQGADGARTRPPSTCYSANLFEIIRAAPRAPRQRVLLYSRCADGFRSPEEFPNTLFRIPFGASAKYAAGNKTTQLKHPVLTKINNPFAPTDCNSLGIARSPFCLSIFQCRDKQLGHEPTSAQIDLKQAPVGLLVLAVIGRI